MDRELERLKAEVKWKTAPWAFWITYVFPLVLLLWGMRSLEVDLSSIMMIVMGWSVLTHTISIRYTTAPILKELDRLRGIIESQANQTHTA